MKFMSSELLFANRLFDSYENFREKTLNSRRIKHAQLVPLIEKLASETLFAVSEEGKSIEKRAINSLKIGWGSIKILLWSQMHGDESTATRALFDIFNFFKSDDFAREKEEILSNCTLIFIPMLNPDGAERFERRNAVGIDLNRDARQLVSPESQLLMNLRNQFEPHFGFNLHDQDPYYSAGETAQPAAMSFLSPAFDFAKTIDAARISGMKVITLINRVLQDFVPDKIGRYSDAFLPSAFGDVIQKTGTTIILVESGNVHYDLEKEFIRKLNFVSIVSALSSISKGSYLYENEEDYNKIPFNKKDNLFDILLKNVNLVQNELDIRADIGLRRVFGVENDTLVIAGIGDLSANSAYDNLNCPEMRVLREIRIGDSADVLVPYLTTSGLSSRFGQYEGLPGLLS